MAIPAEPVIGFPRESTFGDRRTLLIPTVACVLREAGFGVFAEPGIGTGVFCDDADLAAEGVRFAEPEQVWAAPLVLRYKSANPDDLSRLRPGQVIGALFHAEGDRALLSALATSRVTAYSYEFVREDGRFPLAKPGGEVAGIQAVLQGAQALQAVHGGRGVLLARVAGAVVPRVVVIGCGNVGSAAARTAAALGAEVTVLARSEESASRYQPNAPQGVRVAVNTPKIRRSVLAGADLVVGAILVSTFDTPPMITEADLHQMKAGAVIVDATCGYGDGYLPTAGPVQQPGDAPRVVQSVLHVKLDALPALVPITTTQAYTVNAAPYLCGWPASPCSEPPIRQSRRPGSPRTADFCTRCAASMPRSTGCRCERHWLSCRDRGRRAGVLAALLRRAVPLRPGHRGHPGHADADPAREHLGGPGLWVGVDAVGHRPARPTARRGRRRRTTTGDPAAVHRSRTAAGVHTTALWLCGRTDHGDFLARCRSLAALIHADCLAGPLPADPHLAPSSFELVTQFGLLGLCRDAEHFTTSFAAIHRLLTPGGWTAGANWVARHPRGCVELTEQLYRTAATRAGVHLLLLNRIASADPDFPAVWTYVGQTRRTPPCP